MKVFGIKDEIEITRINSRVKARILKYEQDAHEKRLSSGKRLMGKEGLRRQAIMTPHTPKKRDRRIFVIASSEKPRRKFIEMHDEICALCAQLFKKWKRGDFRVQWPPGTFPPSPGVRASALALR